MKTNGTLSYEIISEGVLNEYGEVIESSSTEWSEPIPCSIMTNSDNRFGRYEDGVFRQSSFTILIEVQKVDFTRVKLERLGEDLGVHKIMSAEILPNVGRVKIVV